ncbi:MAG: hypothetical protein U9O41_07465 [Candidatus Aerophobetes bacterium]|nr:hypothetical protein [Candidatus Aerophobetes bacterium]
MGKNQFGKTSPRKGRFLIADKLLEMTFEADGVLREIQPDGRRDGQAYRGNTK